MEHRYQRRAGGVRLLAVSKGHGPDCIREAYAAGIRDFGESYLQEAESKMAGIAGTTKGRGGTSARSGKMSDIVWHFIGPLQANKTRAVAARFQWVHSIDREKVARRLSQQRPVEAGPLDVCVQLRMSGMGEEPRKSGIDQAGLESLCAFVASLPQLRLRGLMAIPPPSREASVQRAYFHTLAACFADLAARFPVMDTLSMGMSGDYEAAIAEGATLIRIGSGIFGPRTNPQK